MEFMQFHPTSLYHPDAESFLISEAVRGYGGILVNSRGEAFMDRDHPMKSLAPRDIVARSIDREMKRTGDACVYLDVTAKDADATRRRFPNIHQRCLDFGIDMTRRPIPVVPAAHYLCGGVVADEWGRTEIDGLYALGEVACTGLHGANRLASNSLLEALVFADRASRHAAMAVATAGLPEMLESRPEREPSGSPVEADEEADRYRLEIRRLMWDCAGIVRRDEELRHAVSRIAETARAVDWLWSQAKKTPALIEARNLVEVAGLIIRSALARRESRGLHYNLDVPERDDRNWRRHTVLRNTD
jgi:L-aspartate oxidase